MALSKPHAGEVWARLASGIEAGIVGGAAMLAILLSSSLWDGHVWWETPNLLGSTFYGIRAFRAGAGLATLSGLALHFVITGSLGGLFGLAFGGIQERGRLVLLGLLASVAWYNLANVTFWPKVNPWVLVASPRPATVVSHVLLGACLGYMGQRHRLAAPPPSDTRDIFISPPGLAHPPSLAEPSDPAPLPGFVHDPEGQLGAEAHLGEGHELVAEAPVVADHVQPSAAAPSDALE
jgi:hypothetical protein